MCDHGSRLPNTGTWIEGAGERERIIKLLLYYKYIIYIFFVIYEINNYLILFF